MRAINQRALLFTYKQRNEIPIEDGDGTNYLPIFNPEKEDLNIEGGIVADITYGKVISLSMYPPKNRRVYTESGYIVKPMHDIETYKLQLKDNQGFRFIYVPDIRGGFQTGIYRITEWDYQHTMTTGGKNKVTARAEFLDSDSFIVSIADIQAEYKKQNDGSGLLVRGQRSA